MTNYTLNKIQLFAQTSYTWKKTGFVQWRREFTYLKFLNIQKCLFYSKMSYCKDPIDIEEEYSRNPDLKRDDIKLLRNWVASNPKYPPVSGKRIKKKFKRFYLCRFFCRFVIVPVFAQQLLWHYRHAKNHRTVLRLAKKMDRNILQSWP